MMWDIGFYLRPLPFNDLNISNTFDSRVKSHIDFPEVSVACIAKSFTKKRDSARQNIGQLLTCLGRDTVVKKL